MTTITQILGEAFIKHHGVKGQKWGVRRAAKKLAKADKKWEENINSVSTFIAVHGRAAQLANDLDVDRINNMPRYKNRNMNDENDPITRAYFKAHEDAFNIRIKQAAEEIIGTNPSGTKKVHIDLKTGVTSLVDVEHDESVGHFEATFNELHHIIKWTFITESMTQTNMKVELFLDHHGVKGQKWGVRNKSRSSGGSSKGKGPTKPDISKLTDAELRTLVNRMQLEQQFRNISKSSSNSGKAFATSILLNVARTTLTGLGTAAAGKAIAKIIK